MNVLLLPEYAEDTPPPIVSRDERRAGSPALSEPVGEVSHDTMKERVRAAMTCGWVTPVEALHKCSCFSLSQRAGELRREGVNVQDKWVDLPSGKRVKAYRIEEARG